MKTYLDRTETEKLIIRLAYEFEINAIAHMSTISNPYLKAIKKMANGLETWEAINEAVEMAFN